MIVPTILTKVTEYLTGLSAELLKWCLFNKNGSTIRKFYIIDITKIGDLCRFLYYDTKFGINSWNISRDGTMLSFVSSDIIYQIINMTKLPEALKMPEKDCIAVLMSMFAQNHEKCIVAQQAIAMELAEYSPQNWNEEQMNEISSLDAKQCIAKFSTSLSEIRVSELFNKIGKCYCRQCQKIMDLSIYKWLCRDCFSAKFKCYICENISDHNVVALKVSPKSKDIYCFVSVADAKEFCKKMYKPMFEVIHQESNIHPFFLFRVPDADSILKKYYGSKIIIKTWHYDGFKDRVMIMSHSISGFVNLLKLDTTNNLIDIKKYSIGAIVRVPREDIEFISIIDNKLPDLITNYQK